MTNEMFFALSTGIYMIGLGVGYILLLKREYKTSFALDNLDDYTEIPEEF